ncbi:hypothetical protein MC885_001731, partial [Smutsia gigantea]
TARHSLPAWDLYRSGLGTSLEVEGKMTTCKFLSYYYLRYGVEE